jgi:hypothetical protein
MLLDLHFLREFKWNINLSVAMQLIDYLRARAIPVRANVWRNCPESYKIYRKTVDIVC